MKKIIDYFKSIFKKKEYSIYFKTAYLLLGSLLFPTIVASTGLVLNISVNIFDYIIGIILLFGSYYYFFYDKNNKKDFFIPIIISIIIYLMCIAVTYVFYDNTQDGLSYHLPATLKLAEGWNPVYHHYDKESIIGIWGEHYPKFIWINGAMLYQITKHVFSPTSFTFVIVFASLFLYYDIIYRITKKNLLSMISSLLISFNIIVVAQFFTMYNDGVLGLCIISSILIYLAVTKDIYKFDQPLNPITIMLTTYLAILANIKFTGALFAFIIGAVYTIVCIWKKKLKFDKTLLAYLLIIGYGVAIVAVNTYIPNIIYHKNIGYPIIGEDKIDIIDIYVPSYTTGKGHIKPFLKSQSQKMYEGQYTYTYPYVIDHDDYAISAYPEARLKGFGPLFQTIMISSFIIFISSIYLLLKKKNKKKELINFIKKNQIELISFGVLFLFFMLTPATWWGRYIPYIYVIPICMITLFNIDYKKMNVISFSAVFIILLYSVTLIVNTSLCMQRMINYTSMFKYHMSILEKEAVARGHLDIETIGKKYHIKDIVVDTMLKNKNIDFTRKDKNKCDTVLELEKLDIKILDCSK